MSEATELTFQLRAVNTDPSLAHKTRSEEIAELPQYLEVVSLVAPGLALLNVGEQEPGSTLSAFPWLKLDSSGNPLGLFWNVGGVWKSALDRYFMRELLADQVTERGELTITMDVAANEWKVFDDGLDFEEEFDEVPYVKLWVIGGSLLDHNNDESDEQKELWGYKNLLVPDEITVSGFKVKAITEVETNSHNKSLKFLWEATGKRAE